MSSRDQCAQDYRVLLAGDGREDRGRVASMLARSGFQVAEFAEWLQLVAFLRDAPLFRAAGETEDVVVLDLRLSGPRLIERTEAVNGSHAPVVLITRADSRLSEEQRNGCEVLEEPLDEELLRTTVLAASRRTR